MDGLGGYADAEHGTELEEAVTPNLDQLAADGIAGLVEPVGPGITPGSGPGHLGLFGYDPEQFELGRGALSAAGLDFELRGGRRRRPRQPRHARRPTARSPTGAPGASPTPRRRPSSTGSRPRVHVPGVEVFFRHEREHRLLVVLRGAGPRRPPRRHRPAAHRRAAARAVGRSHPRPSAPPTSSSSSTRRSARVLADEPKANVVLLRGFDTHRELPGFEERYGLRAAAIAIYPMYRGIARLLGMDVLGRPADLTEQLADHARRVERLRLLLPAPQVHRLRR